MDGHSTRQGARGGIIAGVSNVPCNGCTECCRGPDRQLRVRSGSTAYKTVWINGERHLAYGPNNDCLYVGPHGCTIYEDRPAECRPYDCREVMHDVPERIRVEAVKRLGV